MKRFRFLSVRALRRGTLNSGTNSEIIHSRRLVEPLRLLVGKFRTLLKSPQFEEYFAITSTFCLMQESQLLFILCHLEKAQVVKE